MTKEKTLIKIPIISGLIFFGLDLLFWFYRIVEGIFVGQIIRETILWNGLVYHFPFSAFPLFLIGYSDPGISTLFSILIFCLLQAFAVGFLIGLLILVLFWLKKIMIKQYFSFCHSCRC